MKKLMITLLGSFMPKQDPAAQQQNTTVATKGNAMSIRKFAAVSSAVMLGLAANADNYKDMECIMTSSMAMNWIRLEYTPKASTIIEATIECLAKDQNQAMAIFCSRGSETDKTATTKNTFTCFVMPSNKLRFDCRGNGLGLELKEITIKTKYVIRCQSDGLYVDEEFVTGSTPGLADFTMAGNKLTLFGSYTGATSDDPTAASNFASLKVYGVRIWEGERTDENLKFELIPCLNDQGVPGLRDAANDNQFYPSCGSNAFGYESKLFVWCGTGTTVEANRWSVGANWEGGVAPTADDIACGISIPAVAEGCVISNDIANLRVGELNIGSPTAFTLTGYPLTGAGSFVFIGKDSSLTIAANLTEVGLCDISGADKDSSVLVVTNATASFDSPTFDNITVHFWSSGNAIGTMGGMNVNGQAQIFLHAANSLVDKSMVNLNGRIDLCGQPQRIGSVTGGTGYFYSETPAVLSVDTSEGNAFFGHFEGAAGLKKLSSGTFRIKSTNPTKGSLEVADGRLVMTADATWCGADVSLTAASANLILQGSKNLASCTALKLTDARARVNVAKGVQVCVRSMHVPSASKPDTLVQLAPGVYTSANCSYLTGDGSVEVRGNGLCIFVL